jgi:ATP-dependent helicase HrpA
MTRLEQEAQLLQDVQTDLVSLETNLGYPNLSNPDLTLHAAKSDITSAITEHQAVVIIAPPGVGKSTQAPKIALEAGFDHIIQTQPRRRPAINVGSRILYELGVVLGEEKANELVAWQTGAGRVGPRTAPIEVVTENTLLRRQTFHPNRGTNSIWMLDEIHEESIYQADLMRKAQELRRSNPDFTAVYMSATPDKHGLIHYLTDEFGQEPAVIELSATMFDVENRERPNSDLVTEIVRAAKETYDNPSDYDGANTIIAFESGVKEINDVIEELYTRLPANILSASVYLKKCQCRTVAWGSSEEGQGGMVLVFSFIQSGKERASSPCLLVSRK